MSDLLPKPESTSPFDVIRHLDANGSEYWTARELAVALGYGDYQKFEPVIAKAKLACVQSGRPAMHHFADVAEMVNIGSRAQREIENVWMDRYGCYMVALSADSTTKPQVAAAKTYFAIQARRQEIGDQQQRDDLRLLLRDQMRQHNADLAKAASRAGVVERKDYAIFQNHGYQGLYPNEGMQDIHKRKGLKPSQHILDHMGPAELAANLFRATQTEEKLIRENIQGKAKANQTHFEVGSKVRQTIKDIGGTLPEHLPTVESIKALQSANKKRLKGKGGDGPAKSI